MGILENIAAFVGLPENSLADGFFKKHGDLAQLIDDRLNNHPGSNPVMTVQELYEEWNSKVQDIVSSSSYSSSWLSYFNKIFSLSEFNTAWSTALNKIFDLSAWKTWLLNLTNLSDVYNEHKLSVLELGVDWINRFLGGLRA